MDRTADMIPRFVSCIALPLAAATAMAGCNAYGTAQARTGIIPALSVSCEAYGDALTCRATAYVTEDRTDPRLQTDVTDAVAWTTSNVKTANVLRGRVTANEPGTATIAASMRSGDETLSSSVPVVVERECICPKVAYDLKGMVRDLSNSGITNVALTLADDQGHERATVTSQTDSPSDGAFRFAGVLGGHYRLRATKQGYRPVERLVDVPDTMPLTLVMLFEPR
jgi:hypothetical protein